MNDLLSKRIKELERENSAYRLLTKEMVEEFTILQERLMDMRLEVLKCDHRIGELSVAHEVEKKRTNDELRGQIINYRDSFRWSPERAAIHNLLVRLGIEEGRVEYQPGSEDPVPGYGFQGPELKADPGPEDPAPDAAVPSAGSLGGN